MAAHQFETISQISKWQNVFSRCWTAKQGGGVGKQAKGLVGGCWLHSTKITYCGGGGAQSGGGGVPNENSRVCYFRESAIFSPTGVLKGDVGSYLRV